MKQQKFKRPSDYKGEMAKVVISSRVSQKCKESLEWGARSAGMGVSELVSGILEDYSEWYLSEILKVTQGSIKKFE